MVERVSLVHAQVDHVSLAHVWAAALAAEEQGAVWVLRVVDFLAGQTVLQHLAHLLAVLAQEGILAAP